MPRIGVGGNIIIRIPDVDRGEADLRNLIGIALKRNDDDLYRSGTKSEFDVVCPQIFLTREQVPDAEISLRTAAKKEAIGSEQGGLPTLLEYVPCQQRLQMWFMHDSTRAHFFCNEREHLTLTFQDRWIDWGGLTLWPARSPNLNPLEFRFVALTAEVPVRLSDHRICAPSALSSFLEKLTSILTPFHPLSSHHVKQQAKNLAD
ncbi:hypothetical protein ANN_13793 [Periplaneta americana]|uniref:Tc1-like transposase DDE domain-containing protein n=1 Tax=Periplaneta americana TaxID=6978 RepID=A0ABQ8SVI4_PERAM|nr:hypothetical protein ANN_13793 [Periplaneta americana]